MLVATVPDEMLQSFWISASMLSPAVVSWNQSLWRVVGGPVWILCDCFETFCPSASQLWHFILLWLGLDAHHKTAKRKKLIFLWFLTSYVEIFWVDDRNYPEPVLLFWPRHRSSISGLNSDWWFSCWIVPALKCRNVGAMFLWKTHNWRERRQTFQVVLNMKFTKCHG